jgi:head-to-tail connecting protein
MEKLQDEDLVKSDLLRHAELKQERAVLDSFYEELEQLVDPMAAGGFTKMSPGQQRNYNFDSTAMDGLDRFTAALGAVTTPKNQRWHGLTVLDPNLSRLPGVNRWLEHATDRLFACRYAPHAGLPTAYSEDRRALGCYGTGALWVDEVKGRALFGRALHMSQIYVDVDFRGRVDTVHREFELTARHAKQMFGEESLPPKVRAACYDPKREGDKFTFIHVVRPNELIEAERLDWRGKPIASRYIAVEEKWLVRRGGYWTMPISVSRNVTSPGQKYGTSPTMKVFGTAKGLNEIAKTILRAGHKAVDPALAFFDDGDISKLVTKPGGLNPGLVNEDGRLLVGAVPTGGNHMLGRDIQESERAVVKTAFLEDFFRILTDPADRMTATQVLEMIAKQGVLIQDFADRYESEKLGVTIERELDILMRAGQIEPMPPEMEEAGARPLVVMTNPLARMARAQEASAFTRWVEIGVQAAAAGAPQALDRINWDEGMAGVGDVLGVRPSWILSDDELAEIRRDRAAKEEAAAVASVVPDVAKASLDLAKANQVASALGAGGGL